MLADGLLTKLERAVSLIIDTQQQNRKLRQNLDHRIKAEVSDSSTPVVAAVLAVAILVYVLETTNTGDEETTTWIINNSGKVQEECIETLIIDLKWEKMRHINRVP